MANERSSGTAFFSSQDEKPVLAGAHDYFVNNVLPSDIKACIPVSYTHLTLPTIA